MLIKNLSIIILNDRQDHIFHQALLSAAVAAKIIVFDQETDNDWPNLEKKLKKINPQLNFRLILRKKIIEDFADLRNKAIKKVNTPWLMFLDSDEILSSKNLNTLAQLLKNNQVDGYLIRRVDYFHQKQLHFGETGRAYHLRLARTNKIKYLRPIHEIATVTGQVEKSNLIIKHFPHQNISEFFNAINQYAQIEAIFRFTHNISRSKIKLILETILYPESKFLLNYCLKLGFLDGFAGLTYATLMSLHSLLVRIYLYEKYFLN